MITRILGITDISAGILFLMVPSWGAFDIFRILFAIIMFIKGVPSVFMND